MIHLYSKKGCKNCDVLKKTLTQNGIKFENITIGSLEHIRKKYIDFDEQFDYIDTFPVLVNTIGNENDVPIILGFEESMKLYSEDLLNTANNKYTLFPINPKYQHMYELYKKSRASYWQPEEIDFSKDDNDLIKLSQDEKHFIHNILAFFAASDSLVLENIGCNFSKEIQIQEVLHCYAIQMGIEAIHSETYSLLLDRYIKSNEEKMKLFNALQNIKTIKAKGAWVKKWTNPDQMFAKRLLAFICVEGIMFSGSFCAIYWLKNRGLLPGLCFANELISRDEGLHTSVGIEVYKLLKNKPIANEVYEIVCEAVSHEKEFITESIPCRLIGMNSVMMKDYIEYVCDYVLTNLGYPKFYNKENPFEFMEKISLDGKTNFFEKRVGEYSKAGVMVSNEDQCFKLDEEF